MICSNFPLWRSVIEDNHCGICVEPTDVDAVAQAILKLKNDNQLAKTLGENGRRAVLAKYNWQYEEQKLLAFYKELAG